ncbi:MAG TPA: hypothetical protein VKK31_31905 [Thermoanaerobaculia bacterium]|nr:hypothetical protein [Thermoanaerobaculia bacterium]
MNNLLGRSKRLAIGVAFGILALPALAGETGSARLVADLAPGSLQIPQSVSGFANIGRRAVFLSGDNGYFPALWVTDGTPQGTSPLGVLCPPCGNASLLGSTGSVAFYLVNQGYPDLEARIWRTDGTPAGTFPVTETFTFPQAPPGALASLAGGRLFFTACTPELGCEIWSSDGSPAGTAPVGEIVPGAGSSVIRELAVIGEQAFLLADTPAGQLGLWLADGAGHELKLLRRTPQASRLSVAGNRAVFIAQGDGLEVWTSDGTTAGTRAVTSFAPRDPFGQVPVLKSLDGRFYFVANDGVHGFELWSAGGGTESLRRLTDFSDPLAIVGSVEKAGNRIVFAANQRRTGAKLWSSRGDLRSTSPLAGCLGGCPVVASPLAAVGTSRIVFYGRDGRGDGFWVSDGTGAGTRLLQRSERPHDEAQLVAAGGRVLFDVTNEYEVPELWITDGTVAGTFFVTHGGPGWSHYYGWAGKVAAGSADGRLVFTGREGEGIYNVLWSSDGSPAGSRPLRQRPIGKSSDPQRLAAFRDGLLVQTCTDAEVELRFVRGTATTRLLAVQSGSADYCSPAFTAPVDLGGVAIFSAVADNGISLWRTDGTPSRTAVLVPAEGPDEPEDVTLFGGQAAFWLALSGPGGLQAQLWLTDGTPAGTRKLFDLPANVAMYGLKGIGGKLYFLDDESQPGRDDSSWRPWVSDGTLAGTHPLTGVTDPNLDGVSFGSFAFLELGGRVFFPLAAGDGPLEIWSTDGTAAGTGPAVTAASGMLQPGALSAAGGSLYFAARRTGGPTGRLLPWVSNGTDGGTSPLAGLVVSDGDFALEEDRPRFVELGGRVFFAASDGARGEELWATDGTSGGTFLVRDIAAGLLGSYPRGLVAWRGRLYFRARDKMHGLEPWASDGSARGTRLVQDIAAGASWSAPGELTATGQGLYFSANDGEHGRELWVLPEVPEAP